MKLPLCLTLVLLSTAPAAPARASDLSSVLDEESAFHVDSVRLRYTHYEQNGLGYQSQAGPLRGPGSEEATIDQPQLEIIAHQGPRITHRIWIPVDIVSAASPDAIDGWPPARPVDVVSEASRKNEAGSLDLTTTYQQDRSTQIFLNTGFHLEEEWRSFNLGGGWSRSVADDNAVLSASVHQVYDWFDAFNIRGGRLGHTSRSSTNGNLSLTQLLSPTTVANLNYGVTMQVGTLGNTWNVVPLANGTIDAERLPSTRLRHALVGRLSQWLPWNGVIKGFYRLYLDDWGLIAHTLEAELFQRIIPGFYVRANYRFHAQNAASFWSIEAPSDDLGATPLRTADSDLAAFYSQTFGLKAAMDLPLSGRIRELHADIGFERYIRTNNFSASIATCSIGLRFR